MPRLIASLIIATLIVAPCLAPAALASQGPVVVPAHYNYLNGQKVWAPVAFVMGNCASKPYRVPATKMKSGVVIPAHTVVPCCPVPLDPRCPTGGSRQGNRR